MTRGEPATEALQKGEWSFNQCLKVPKNKKIKVTLKPDSTIHDVVAWISSMTCRHFIVGSNIRAQKITIYSPVSITPREAYRAFISALNVMGLTVQPSGRYLKIIESRAQGINTLCVPGKYCPKDDRIVTRIFRLKHVSPKNLKGILDALKSKNGKVITYEYTGLLILTDSARIFARLHRIVRKLDVKSKGDGIWVTRIQNAVASELAQVLSEVFEVGGGKKRTSRRRRRKRRRRKRSSRKRRKKSNSKNNQGPKGVEVTSILSDDRTNLLIVVADKESYLHVKALIHKLDIPIKGGKERVHVIHLANADAEEMRDTLSGLTGGRSSRRRRSSRKRRKGRSKRSSRRSRRGGTVGLFEGEVQVTADSSTNTLLVVASMKDFLSLKKVVDRLDVPRRQVFVEASILEVSLSKTRNLGFSWHGGQPVGSGDNKSLLLFGNDASKSMALDPTALTGLALGLRGPELKDAESLLGIPGISFPTMGPTTTKKKIKTVIVLGDQQTAVLGGLITEKTKKNITKVPLLGDIPILGYLFKKTTTVKEKSNLLIFLTPYIIRNQSDLRRIFRRKMQKRREFIERYTMFKDFDMKQTIDYRHTRGLLAEINRVANAELLDAKRRQKALEESKAMDVDGPVSIRPEDRKALNSKTPH